MSNLSWSFFDVVNTAAARPEREVKERDYLWASELSLAPVDVILRLRGTQPTNPPNPRSMRKFHAGNVWESYVYLVLWAAGILKADQTHLSYQYPDMLEVTGRLDFLAGGVADWDRARATVADIGYLEPIRYFIDNMIDEFEKKYGNRNLKEIVIEVKSVSAFMWPRYQALGRPNPSHELQTFHYLKATNHDEGHIAYISKDDSQMLEFGVMNPGPVEDRYKGHIKLLTDYYKSGELPDKELEVKFDEDTGRFGTNWRVEYSNYLSMLYDYKTPEAYRERWGATVSSFNRTLGRIVRGERVTAKNAEAIEQIKSMFTNFDEIVEKAKNIAKLGVADAEVIG